MQRPARIHFARVKFPWSVEQERGWPDLFLDGSSERVCVKQFGRTDRCEIPLRSFRIFGYISGFTAHGEQDALGSQDLFNLAGDRAQIFRRYQTELKP